MVNSFKPKIYCASKIWHAEKWLKLRDEEGYNIISTWINYPCGTKEKPGGALQLNLTQQQTLWENCVQEVNKCDLLIAYAEEGEEHRGVLVEIGGALAHRHPVFLIGRCDSFRKSDASDAAFMHHPLFYPLHIPDFPISTGCKVAVEKYWKVLHDSHKDGTRSKLAP